LTLQKDLSVQADLARPPAQTLGQNLAEIFEAQSCCDIILVYHGHRIPAHKSILMARCPYFSRHLAFHRSNEFHLRTRGCVVPLEVLKSVLKYLYTDNAELLGNTTRGDAEAMTMLEDEFGIPNSLESDVSFLLETLSLGDLKLVFDGAAADFLCHKTILAARSPFFGRLIGKKAALAAAASAAALLAAGGSSSEIMEIRLDSQIIPAKYAKILLNALYLDSLDFRLVEPGDNVTVAESSAAEDHVTEAMELYEIGRFLEFNFLSQSCEDLLMQVMSMSNVTAILDWSLEPHGSSWIGRQAYQFLEEEFFNVSNNQDHVLGSLNAGTMVRILKSDFTQASESEVLQVSNFLNGISVE
jgi:BTB/POZ domain-containing protein 7